MNVFVLIVSAVISFWQFQLSQCETKELFGNVGVKSYLEKMMGTPASNQLRRDLEDVVNLLRGMDVNTELNQFRIQQPDMSTSPTLSTEQTPAEDRHDPVWNAHKLKFALAPLGLPVVLAPAVLADLIVYAKLVKAGAIGIHTFHHIVQNILAGLILGTVGTVGALKTAGAVKGVTATGLATVGGLAAAKVVDAIYHKKHPIVIAAPHAHHGYPGYGWGAHSVYPLPHYHQPHVHAQPGLPFPFLTPFVKTAVTNFLLG